MNGMMMENYLKIKEGLSTGKVVELDGHPFGVFDLCLLEKKLKDSFCCEDFRLVVEDYKKVTITRSHMVRFSGSAINFCPFCGSKFEVI